MRQSLGAVLVCLSLATCAPHRASSPAVGPSTCTTPTTRHAAVRHAFLLKTGYPKGRPGYVVDHITPLCACGPDTVENMQWQTATDAAIKDIGERQQCAAIRKANKKG